MCGDKEVQGSGLWDLGEGRAQAIGGCGGGKGAKRKASFFKGPSRNVCTKVLNGVDVQLMKDFQM